MPILRFHPARLFTRAVDGAFGVVELPALLVRPGLYAQSGRLRVRQGMSERLFVFAHGALADVQSTEAGESLASVLARLVERNDPRVDSALETARRRGFRLVDVLAGALRDKELAVRVLRAQAARVVEGAIAVGPAVAWFERGAPARAQMDLHAFDAVWRAVLALWPEVDRFALGRHIQATGCRPLEAAGPYLRTAGAAKSLIGLARAATTPKEHELSELGALALCGLVQSQAGAFTIDAVGVSEVRRRGEHVRPHGPARGRPWRRIAVLCALLVLLAGVALIERNC